MGFSQISFSSTTVNACPSWRLVFLKSVVRFVDVALLNVVPAGVPILKDADLEGPSPVTPLKTLPFRREHINRRALTSCYLAATARVAEPCQVTVLTLSRFAIAFASMAAARARRKAGDRFSKESNFRKVAAGNRQSCSRMRRAMPLAHNIHPDTPTPNAPTPTHHSFFTLRNLYAHLRPPCRCVL